MRLEDLNWMDVESYLQTDDRIILITGAAEQHAYLSLLTDILIPSKIALAAAERERVLVAPPLNFGMSDYFMAFPGTISLSEATFHAVVTEVVNSLRRHGFRRFFVLNGHGGNTVPPALQTLRDRGEIGLIWYNWWQQTAARAFEAHFQARINHANWGENFPFNRVAQSPAGSKADVNLAGVTDPAAMRAALGDGSFGGPYQISDDQMQTLFAMVVNDVTDLLRDMPPISR